MRSELLQRDAREGHQPGWRHFRLKLPPCSERLCGVCSPGQQWVGCPCPKNSQVLRDELHVGALWEREGTKDTGCPT